MKAKNYGECCEGYLEQNKSMWIQSQVFRNKITCANWKNDKSTRDSFDSKIFLSAGQPILALT